MRSIPLTPVQRDPAPPHRPEAPYQAYILASLALAIGGGFALAVMLPLAQALQWRWGATWPALVEAHGQLQLDGFVGLFIIGMAFRLMPRFSGRDLAYPPLVRAIMPLVATSLLLRAFAQPAADSPARDAALVASAILLLIGSLAFAAIVVRMLAHPHSRAEATGWFFTLGAIAYVAAAALNAWFVAEMVRDGLSLAPQARKPALLFVQLYGFVLMFVGGVSTRAVPMLSGRPRAARLGRAAAALLAAGVVLYAAAALRASYAYSRTTARAEDFGLLATAAALLIVVWISGVFHPRADRVAPASRSQFTLVRSALAWLAFAALLTAWYAARAFRDGTVIDQFELDAIRHALAVGVVTTIIVGMGMMILPEFAGRRIQRPREGWIAIAMLVALNAASVLRVWPALEGLGWLAHTRYWPMTAAGALAEAVVVTFAFMFVQSWLEQRAPGWGGPEALARRRS